MLERLKCSLWAAWTVHTHLWSHRQHLSPDIGITIAWFTNINNNPWHQQIISVNVAAYAGSSPLIQSHWHRGSSCNECWHWPYLHCVAFPELIKHLGIPAGGSCPPVSRDFILHESLTASRLPQLKLATWHHQSTWICLVNFGMWPGEVGQRSILHYYCLQLVWASL